MSAWALSTTMPPLIHELGAGRDDGRLVALTHLLWSAGMLTGTTAAGALVEVHPAAPFALALVCLLVTLAAAVRFARLRGAAARRAPESPCHPRWALQHSPSSATHTEAPYVERALARLVRVAGRATSAPTGRPVEAAFQTRRTRG
jgi:hypothetical protein